MLGPRLFVGRRQISRQIVEHRDIHQRDVARVCSGEKVGPVDDAPVGPEPGKGPRRLAVRRKMVLVRGHKARMGDLPAEQPAGPGGLESWLIVPPLTVIGRALDRVILTFPILHGKTDREGLDIVRLGDRGGRRLAGLGL